MPTHVAFLRGINVGGHRVANDELGARFEALGLADVAPYQASGNVLFTPDGPVGAELEARIAAHLEESLGYAVATFVRSLRELDEITRFPPVVEAEAEGRSCHVIFLAGPAPDELKDALAALECETDAFHLRAREVLWVLEGRLSDSPVFGKALDRATRGVANTMRNMNTIRRIVSKFGEG